MSIALRALKYYINVPCGDILAGIFKYIMMVQINIYQIDLEEDKEKKGQAKFPSLQRQGPGDVKAEATCFHFTHKVPSIAPTIDLGPRVIPPSWDLKLRDSQALWLLLSVASKRESLDDQAANIYVQSP